MQLEQSEREGVEGDEAEVGGRASSKNDDKLLGGLKQEAGKYMIYFIV